MNLKQVKQLLEQYYEGETSLQEEKALVQFFQSDEVPEELKIDQAQFLFYEAAQKETTHNNYTYASQVSKGVLLRPKFLRIAIGIAASFLLISGSFYFLKQQGDASNTLTAEELIQSKQAYAETRKALLLISEKLNKGANELNKISKFNEVHNSIIQQ